MPAAAPPIPPSALRRGFNAARANLLPGAILWVVGAAVLLGYFYTHPIHRALEYVAAAKMRWGVLFAIISTATFGGLLPVLLRPLTPHGSLRSALRDLPFYLVFWGIKGVEVDLLYRGLAAAFGEQPGPTGVAAKVCIDQFVYVPLWAIPSTVLPFLWHECGYSFARTRRRLEPGWGWYPRRVWPVILVNWCLWTPVVVMIYLMPLALQLPLQNLVLCLWSLLLIFMIGPREETGPPMHTDEIS